MKRLIFTVIFFFGFIGSVNANCDPGEKIIRFGTINDVDFAARTRAAKLLGDAINKEMQGKLCLQIVANESLYKGTLAIAALQSGDVQMVAPSFATLAGFARDYRVFELPFAFRDVYALQRFQLTATPSLKDALSRNGVELLSFWHERFKQMSAKRVISSPAAASGLKFRQDDGETFATQIRLMNATRQTVSENDLLIALKQGRVDAQISNWQQLQEDKTASANAVVTETNHAAVGYQLITSKAWWGSLDPALAKRLTELISRMSRQSNFDAITREINSKRILMRSGVPVHTLTRKQRKQWGENMQPIWDRFSNLTLLAALERANKAP